MIHLFDVTRASDKSSLYGRDSIPHSKHYSIHEHENRAAQLFDFRLKILTRGDRQASEE